MKAARTGVLLVVLLCCACAVPVKDLDEAETAASVYLVNHGKHAGIVIRRGDIPSGVWPESADFPEAEYLEVGWGDWDYYQAREIGLWMTLKAAFWPTASVLNVVGLQSPVESYYPYSEIIELRPSQGRLERLTRYIHDSYLRNGKARAEPLGAPPYGRSRFYPAVGRFHIFNTCNVWVARGLQYAGYPITPFYAITAGRLTSEASRFGREIPQQRPVR
jgi:uncharacterized protein (TIGR02117 family)